MTEEDLNIAAHCIACNYNDYERRLILKNINDTNLFVRINIKIKMIRRKTLIMGWIGVG